MSPYISSVEDVGLKKIMKSCVRPDVALFSVLIPAIFSLCSRCFQRIIFGPLCDTQAVHSYNSVVIVTGFMQLSLKERINTLEE